MGDAGSIPRKFGNEEQFLANITFLQRRTNEYIDVVYGLVSKARDKFPKLAKESYEINLSLVAS